MQDKYPMAFREKMVQQLVFEWTLGTDVIATASSLNVDSRVHV